MNKIESATWQLAQVEPPGKGEQPNKDVLSIVYYTDSLTQSFHVCKIAAELAAKYGLDEQVSLQADPLKALIMLNIDGPSNLTDDYFALAQEVSIAINSLY